MDYTQYKESRDLSWKILIKQNVNVLPVKISKICIGYGIEVLSYSKNEELITEIGNGTELSNDGFTYNKNGKAVIFYDDTKSPQRCRFTIGHELGHILLGHVGK